MEFELQAKPPYTGCRCYPSFLLKLLDQEGTHCARGRLREGAITDGNGSKSHVWSHPTAN